MTENNCFIGIVGMRELDADAIYWVNDISGVTSDLCIELQTSDNSDFTDFWQMIKNRSYLKLLSDFTISFYQKYAVYCRDRADIQTILPSIICQYKVIFGHCFLNLVGMELLLEKIYSNRINFFTTHNIERTKELAGFYKDAYETMFKNAMVAVEVPEEIEFQRNFPNNIASYTYLLP